LWCSPAAIELLDIAEPQHGAIDWEIAGQSKTWKMRKVCYKWPSRGRRDGRLQPASIRKGDEAARSRPLWQSHALKRNAADLRGAT
jgi:hypothetical protein